MAVIPHNEVIASTLASRGVYPLQPREQQVPDEWLSLLGRLHDIDGAGQPRRSDVSGSPP